MNQFPTAGHLCSWAGVVPANNESAGKKFSTRISKGSQYLKPLLVEVANAVVRSEKYPEHRNKYLQLKKTKRAQKSNYCDCSPVACGNLSHVKKDEQYDPTLYHYQEVVLPNKKLSIQEAVCFAKSHRFQVV